MPDHIIQLRLLLRCPAGQALAMRQHSIPALAHNRGDCVCSVQRRSHQAIRRCIRWLRCDRPFGLLVLVSAIQVHLGEFGSGLLPARDIVCWAAIDPATEIGDEEGVLDVGEGGESSDFGICMSY
jgi:hypothetical protein